MHAAWSDRVDFVTVYIREAHPTDEWQVPANEADSVCYAQPRTLADRLAIAKDFTGRFSWALPMVVDPMENPAERAYAAWPERLYVVGRDGRIAHKGAMGPDGFDPEGVEAWLQANVSAPAP